MIGVSGGLDSTYLVNLCMHHGLRPLLVHFDNGWNSELAIDNIRRIIDVSGFDLHTYVMDWETFRQMQVAYLRASVVDIEVLTDHAIFATMYRIALKFDIPSVLSGVNIETEGFLPFSWTYIKGDKANIKDICRQFGVKDLNNYPFIDDKIDSVIKNKDILVRYDLLNYLEYNVKQVKEEILNVFGWRDYGGKHYESIFTRFYQGYILPKKFGIHKRRAHLSNLICSGQIERSHALETLKTPAYPEELLNRDMEYVLKKLQLSQTEWSEIMNLPPKKHSDFLTSKSFFYRHRILRPIGYWRSARRQRATQ
ncbi:N-acetyl sugar amidotransferase [Magnetococcus sp. PR-3]|uniref:N-acetyl sugar amidotransferase n=1 Tax=Magnetococcus sp. PR-3 TaxID=3120355 RepID=UPI002FCDED8B